VIFDKGSLRIEASHFVLKCNSIQGEGFWWQHIEKVDQRARPAGSLRLR
jgi:hypothetical protein